MDMLSIFEQIAENGHAPKAGCRRFGVGYDDTHERLRRVYLEHRFGRGKSAEKFVVGVYGSGKTHFLRTMAELAREAGCATSEVALNTDLDPSQSLMVYQVVARELVVPGGVGHGIKPFLEATLESVGRKAEADGKDPHTIQWAWVEAADSAGLALSSFGRVVRKTLEAILLNQDAIAELGCRWLEGDVNDRKLASKVGEAVVPRAEHNLFGRGALLSLLQFVKRSGYRGTVVGFDEADQGLSMIEGKKMQRILSMFMSGINAMQDLEGGSALILYAVTPPIIDRMMDFPPLQQRVVDPGPGQGFFDGNHFAPQVLLARRPEPEAELRAIAEKLVRLFFDEVPGAPASRRAEFEEKARLIAKSVDARDPSASSRREVARQICAALLSTVSDGQVPESKLGASEAEV